MSRPVQQPDPDCSAFTREGAELAQLERTLSATPAQRLEWLEKMQAFYLAAQNAKKPPATP